MNARAEQGQRYRLFQVAAVLMTIVFWSVIAYGYFLLFYKSPLLAIVLGAILASLAVILAKIVGGEEHGVKRLWPLFAFLLVISAAGIFNTLMLNFEGRFIFKDAIAQAQDDYSALRDVAVARLAKSGALQHQERVDGLRDALISEIRNPLNCGQGPEARKIMAQLQQELPQFRPLSAGKIDCSHNSEVISDYRQRIDDLSAMAPWNNPALSKVANEANQQRIALEKLEGRSAKLMATSLLGETLPELRSADAQYRDLYQLASGTGEMPSNVSRTLTLQSVEGLGETTQLPNLVLDRIGEATTWLYFILAVAFDSLMVFIFAMVRRARPRKASLSLPTGGPARAWS